MTRSQKLVLIRYANERLGALLFDGKWRFPCHVREDADLAYRMAKWMGFNV